jgi:hypothetical protein
VQCRCYLRILIVLLQSFFSSILETGDCDGLLSGICFLLLSLGSF